MSSTTGTPNVKTGYQKLLEIREELPKSKLKVVDNFDSNLGMVYNEAGITFVNWHERESHTDAIYMHEECLDDVVRVIKEIKGVDVL